MEEFGASQDFSWIGELILKMVKDENQELALTSIIVFEVLITVEYNQQHKYILCKQTLPDFIALGSRLLDRLKLNQE